MNLIIIDDEPIQHFIMDKMLNLYVSSDKDHTTHSVSGAHVLEFLAQNKNNMDELPDIIFLDLNMPVMSGWDFLERFKKLHKQFIKSIKIYVISSSIDPNDISRSRKYSFVKDYIIKPMTKLALKKIFDTDKPDNGRMLLN